MGILSKQTTTDLQQALLTEIDQLSWKQKENLLHVLQRLNAHHHEAVDITLTVPQNQLANEEAAAHAAELLPQHVPGGTVWQALD